MTVKDVVVFLSEFSFMVALSGHAGGAEISLKEIIVSELNIKLNKPARDIMVLIT